MNNSCFAEVMMRALINVIQLAFSPVSTCVRNFSPYAISIVKLGMQGHEN